MKTAAKFPLMFKSALAALFAFSAIQLACAAPPNQALSLKDYTVVPVKNGITQFDFAPRDSDTSDNRPGYIVSTHRENFNAHSFDLTSFYAFEIGDSKSTLGSIPVFDGDKENANVVRSGGADCVLKDFRLLQARQGKPLLLIVANRSLGQSFADENDVTFDYYQLKENTATDFGRPYMYFERVATRKAKKKYCDVGRAFQSELGLGPYDNTQQ